MKQWINLYLAVPKLFVVRLPAKMILKICSVFLIVLLSFSIYGYWQKRAFNREIQEIEAQKQVVNEKVIQLTEQYAKDPEVSLLAKQVSYLKREIQIKSYVLNELKKSASSGFSKYFNALSQKIVPDVWISQISISDGGKAITLVGNAYKLEDITQFIKNLEQDPAFAGKQFKLTKVARMGDSEAEKKGAKKELGFTMHIQEEIAE